MRYILWAFTPNGREYVRDITAHVNGTRTYGFTTTLAEAWPMRETSVRVRVEHLRKDGYKAGYALAPIASK